MSDKLYELGLMIFILTNKSKNRFDINRELKISGKFSNIAIRHNDCDKTRYTFIQTKLANNFSLINSKVLLGEDNLSFHPNDFELHNHFNSYLRINDQLKARGDNNVLEKLIVFTNAGIDTNDVKNYVVEVTNSYISKTLENAKCYKINNQVGHNNLLIRRLKLNMLKSDLEKLSELLAHYAVNPNFSFMDLNADCINYYHTALIDDNVIVIENKFDKSRLIKRGRFSMDFIEGEKNKLSPRAQKLRGAIITCIKRNWDGTKTWKVCMKSAEWIVSDDFVSKSNHERIFLPGYDITPEDISSFFKILELRVSEVGLSDLPRIIKNHQIKQVFSTYYNTDPKCLEFIMEFFLKNWRNRRRTSKDLANEEWISSTDRNEFMLELSNTIAKPKMEHKSTLYTSEIEEVISRFDLVFNDDFFTYNLQEEVNVFVIETHSTVLTSAKLLECLKKNNRGDFVFVYFNEPKPDVASVLTKSEWNIFVLPYESVADQQNFFTNLDEIVGTDKKLIFIHSVTKDYPITYLSNCSIRYKEILDQNIGLKYLKNPSKILEETILLQGRPTPLNKLIDERNAHLIDAEIMEKIISRNDHIKIGSKPFGITELEGPYCDVSEKINVNTLVSTLLRKSNDLYVIAQLHGENKKKRFTKILKENTTANRLKLLVPKLENNTSESIEGYNFKIILTDDLNESIFKKICRDNPGRIVYWINLQQRNETRYEFELQQFYNPDFYIQRKFKRRVIVRQSILNELITTDEMFIFSCVDNVEVNVIADRSKVKTCSSLEEGQKVFNSMKNQYPTIHLLQIGLHNGYQRIEWISSCGSLEYVWKHVDNSSSKVFSDETVLIKNVGDEKVLIFADGPGMGKSTTITKLYECKAIAESHWVMRINLKDHLRSIRDVDDVNMHTLTAFMSRIDKSLDSRLATNILKLTLCDKKLEKPLLMIFDGFDELWDKTDREKVISISKFLKEKTNCKLWITTRSHYKHHLEKALSTFAVEFERVDDTKRQEFVQMFYKHRLKLILDEEEFNKTFTTDGKVIKGTKMWEYTKAFMEKLESVFQHTQHLSEFIETPLHLCLMLEGSLSNFIDWLVVNDTYPDFDYLGNDMNEVYENFINRKYDTYFRKVGVTQRLAQEENKIIFNHYNKQLAKSLVLKAHPQTNLKKFRDIVLSVGIIKSQVDNETDIKFIHPTFKEYFAAQLFTTWIEKSKSKLPNIQKQEYLISEILLNRDYKLTRNFMNLKLTKVDKFPEVGLKQYAEVISKLWHRNMDILVDSDRYTILHVAAHEHNCQIANFISSILAEKPAVGLMYNFLKIQDVYNDTALHISSSLFDEDMLRLILKLSMEKLSPEQLYEFLMLQDQAQRTVLHNVSHMEDAYYEMLNELRILYNHAFIIPKMERLDIASVASEGLITIVSLVLNAAANSLTPERFCNFLKVQDEMGQTALHYVSGSVDVPHLHILGTDLVILMLHVVMKRLSPGELYSLLSIQDDVGKTMLHYSCENTKAMTNSILNRAVRVLSLEQLYNFLKITDNEGHIALYHVNVNKITAVTNNKGVLLKMAESENRQDFIDLFNKRVYGMFDEEMSELFSPTGSNYSLDSC